MEPWLAKLEEGDADRAWDRFLERYRRLIFATIRHYADDYDDVMDVFAQVCAALRENNLAVLRRYTDESVHRARFSTWLVAVVRNQVIDWFRHRDGRARLSKVSESLPPLRRKIFEYVFHRSCSHVEAYELIRTNDHLDLPFGQFLRELAATYRAVREGRRGHLMRELAGPLPPSHVDDCFEAPLHPSDTRERLDRVLESLEPQCRLAVQLYVVEGVRAAEVAQIVGWPNAKAVYNRVSRALRAMRAEFERQGIDARDL